MTIAVKLLQFLNFRLPSYDLHDALFFGKDTKNVDSRKIVAYYFSGTERKS